MARHVSLIAPPVFAAGTAAAEPAAAAEVPAPQSPPQATDVVVVGAGLAGLVTAYELQKRGMRTHLLEAQPYTGGRVATANYGDGLAAEYGMQEIWSNNPLIGIADELGVALEMSYEKCAHSTFMHEDRIYPDLYDGTMRSHWDSFLKQEERLALEHWLQGAQDLFLKATTRGLEDSRVRALQNMSLEHWLSSSPELSELAQAWLKLHVEVEVGSEWNRVSALFALLEMEILFDGGAACYAVAGGNAALVDALEESAGPLTVSARVTAISRVRDDRGMPRMRVRYIKDRRVGFIEARRVVLAVPFWRLHQIDVDLPLSHAHWQAINTLQTGHYVPVHLLMDAPGTTIATHDGVEVSDVLTGGSLGYVYGVVATNDTEAVFSLLVYGERARALHMVPQSASVGALLKELDRLQPGFSRHVRDAHVYSYHPAAIPVWGPGRSPLDRLSALLREPVDGLYLAGDYLYGAHANSAAYSGVHAAERIAEDLGWSGSDARTASAARLKPR